MRNYVIGYIKIPSREGERYFLLHILFKEPEFACSSGTRLLLLAPTAPASTPETEPVGVPKGSLKKICNKGEQRGCGKMKAARKAGAFAGG